MLCQIFEIMILINQLSCETLLRSIGGRPATRNEFPFVVELTMNIGDLHKKVYDWFCTGSALTPTWTLTASHCVELVYHDCCYIRYNNYYPYDKGNLSKIINALLHPAYYTSNYLNRNDIGLIFTEPITVVRFAKLSAKEFTTLYGQEALAVGYGITNSTESPAPLQVVLGMVGKCLRPVIFPGFCLLKPCGIEVGLTGGDSGGPVVHTSGIIGVNSMSNARYDKIRQKLLFTVSRAPSGYIAAVSADLTWIYKTIKVN